MNIEVKQEYMSEIDDAQHESLKSTAAPGIVHCITKTPAFAAMMQSPDRIE